LWEENKTKKKNKKKTGKNKQRKLTNKQSYSVAFQVRTAATSQFCGKETNQPTKQKKLITTKKNRKNKKIVQKQT
jgi:hypothetical protein